ncbi:hypothetical protein Gohar_011687 [Gossypium harknessii]|uniref:Proteasome subunit beta n=1 Tax=Gossypium harknessii TaxID=34285 RepID=A0A7J9GW34_9ROSI|nr:hypothetical protein [Gossypium harknessii]
MECVFGFVGNGFAVVAADTSAVHSILVHKSNEDKIMVLDSHKLIAASGESGDRVQFTEYIQKNVALYQFRNGIPLTTAAAANFTRGELATALRKVHPLAILVALSLRFCVWFVGLLVSGFPFHMFLNEIPVKFLFKSLLIFVAAMLDAQCTYWSLRFLDLANLVLKFLIRLPMHIFLLANPYFVNILLAGYDKETGPSLYYIDYIATLHKVDKGAFGYGSYFSLSMMDRHYHSGMTVEEAIDLVDKCIMEIRSRLVVAPPNFVIKIVDKDGAREYAWRESVKDAAVASA